MNKWGLLITPLLCWIVSTGTTLSEKSTQSFMNVQPTFGTIPSAQPGDTLLLRSAIQIGLLNNPEVKASYAKVNASGGRFWSALSPAPMVFSITNDNIPVGQNINNYSERTFEISQSIDFPTNYLLRGSKYSLEKKIAENELLLTKLGVISKIKRAYFNVLSIREQLKITEKNYTIAQDFVKKAEIHFAVGEGSNLEKLTAKVSCTEIQNKIEIQKNHLIAAFAELNFAMGHGKVATQGYQLSDSLSFVPFNYTLDHLLENAMSTHPELRENELFVKYCTAEKALAWSSLLPNFDLAYFNKRARNKSPDNYGVSLSIGVPLWFLFDQRGKIQEANANSLVARSELAMAVNSVYAKTQEAFAEFKHEEKQIQFYMKEILPQAEEIFRIAAKSYEVGEITYIEYLQAQQTLVNARGNCIDALLSYNLAIITVEEVIGKTLQ